MHPTMPSAADASSSEMLDSIDGLLPSLLGGLDRIIWVQRQLYPPLAPRLAEELAPSAEALAGPLRALEAAPCPADLRFMRDRLAEVTKQTLDLIGDFVEAAHPPGEPL